MSFELVIRPEAEADAREAFHWYEEQLRGLGESFLSEPDRELTAISVEPALHARVHREIRRALLHRFPYGVYHLVESRRVAVLAILHTSRHPRHWARRQGASPEDAKDL